MGETRPVIRALDLRKAVPEWIALGCRGSYRHPASISAISRAPVITARSSGDAASAAA